MHHCIFVLTKKKKKFKMGFSKGLNLGKLQMKESVVINQTNESIFVDNLMAWRRSAFTSQVEFYVVV